MLAERFPQTAEALKRGGLRIIEDEVDILLEFFEIDEADADKYLLDWVNEDASGLLRTLKSIAVDLLVKRLIQAIRDLINVEAVSFPLSLSDLEIRRQRGVVDRVTTTITLDPIIVAILRKMNEITGEKISYLLENALVESASFHEVAKACETLMREIQKG